MAFVVLALVQIVAVSLAISVARRMEGAGSAMLVGNIVGVGVLFLGIALITFLMSYSLLVSPL